MENQRSNKRALLGLVLVLVGVVVILANFNLFPFGLRPVLFSWQALLIILGVFFLLSREGRTAGLVLIFIGGIFMIPRVLHGIPLGWHELFWPALLLGLGAILILRGVSRKHEPIEDGPDYIDDMSIFGGGDRLAKGRNIIDIFTVFGGCKFIIPEDWDIKIDVSSVFGGFSDKRSVRRDVPRDPSKELIIKGVAIFGGGDVVSY
jgi:predicted membrane protein